MYYPSIFNDAVTGNLFEELFGLPIDCSKQLRNEITDKRRCTTDIKEFEDRYELDMELPGYKKEDIKAELKDGYLIVSADYDTVKEEKTEDGAAEGEEAKAAEGTVEAEKPVKYLCRERFYGKTQRSFYVGKNITKEDIKGNFVNGVLTLTVPKKDKPIENSSEFIDILG